jgi:alkanesulfonate monooxygenase SsuD/methylene tetrahydromethanopterin reductase-like flavin-dependent oxidoreductase (luciferase family)
MEIDVGLDSGLTYGFEAEAAVAAARAGYGRIWASSGGDPFQTCALRWAATRTVVRGGIGTAIGIVPVTIRSPADLAQSGSVLSRLTGGRFILGIGAGSAYQSGYRRTWGVREPSPLALVRAYLTTVRGFLGGDHVSYEGSGISYEGASLPGEPSATPLFLGAVGPEMTKLGGELADGVYLSWCTAESLQSARTLTAEGAARAGRDPSQIVIAASFRVSVDDDVDAARRALAAALYPYALGWDGTPPRAYRAQFERMGFAQELADLDRQRDRGAARDEIIDSFPEPMLRGLGYFGPASGAADAVRRQMAGADIAVVRVVPSGPALGAVQAVLDACRPAPEDVDDV